MKPMISTHSKSGNALLWIVFILTFFCIFALVFSVLDVRRKKQAVVPPPVYTGQEYEKIPDTETAWEDLLPPRSEEYEDALKRGDL